MHDTACHDSNCLLQSNDSMLRARKEVMEFYDRDVGTGEIADILVSCGGTWRKRGFTSLYGVVFVIAHETGKMLDFHVMSKECQGCRLWEEKENTPEYAIWKGKHQCKKVL